MTTRQFGRKVSVFAYFAIAITTILCPPLGLALIALLFGRKGWTAYQAHRRRAAFEAHIDQAMAVNTPTDREPRAAGYLPRIIERPNPQDQ